MSNQLVNHAGGIHFSLDPAIIFMIAVIAVVAYILSIRLAKSRSYPYIRRGKLLTPTETNFFNALEAAVGVEYRIFAQVRIADVLLVKNGLTASRRQTAFNKISSKHVDFVLCDKNNLAVVCAIELDDRSHRESNRATRDDFINHAFLAAKLPLVRFKARNRYQASEIRTRLEEDILHVGMADKCGNTEHPSCPRCGSKMVKRKSSKGRNAGELFWGCSKYPQCKGIIATK